MHKSLPVLSIAALCVLAPLANAGAQQQSVSLDATAGRDGYVMQWLLPERSVSLFRPGLEIVLRPGAVMYYVNDRVEFADSAPVYTNGDLLLSPALSKRLQRLAAIAAANQPRPARYTGGIAASQSAAPVATGPVTINVRAQAGSEALLVNGHAPSSAPVTITLLATISSDLPTVVVSRHDVQPDVSGNFQAVVPIASAYERNTILHVLATSAAGSTPASAQFVVGAPNAGVDVPLERQPQDPR